MNLNYLLVIVTESNGVFSSIKANSPKMYNAMKKLCDEYKLLFNQEYKVKRVMPTKTGYKFI